MNDPASSAGVSKPLSGVRGRVVLTVLVVTACLYSLLGSIGFLHIAHSGRNAIRERIAVVLDQLETSLRSGSGTVSILTPDGVEAVAVEPGSSPPVPSDDIEVTRTITIGTHSYALVRHASRQFTSDAAHELRTPLMALQGEIELAMRTAAVADSDFLTRIEVLASRLARRVDDLVLLSTLDEQPPLDRRPADLLAIVHAEAASLPVGDGAPSIDIVGQGVTAVVDERLVARAVRNLLVNAVRHASRVVRVEVERHDGRVLVHVDDDGPGVAPADREVVLRRFGWLDEARDADSGGAGLGLAIVASVAHAHGGDVGVSDAVLGGARFSLSLPAD